MKEVTIVVDSGVDEGGLEEGGGVVDGGSDDSSVGVDDGGSLEEVGVGVEVGSSSSVLVGGCVSSKTRSEGLLQLGFRNTHRWSLTF